MTFQYDVDWPVFIQFVRYWYGILVQNDRDGRSILRNNRIADKIIAAAFDDLLVFYGCLDSRIETPVVRKEAA